MCAPLPPSEKNARRKKHLARLQELAQDNNIAIQSAALRQMLIEQFLSGSIALRVAIYASLPHELDLRPLHHEAPQHHYAYPRCEGKGRMHFYLVSQPDKELSPGRMNIDEPVGSTPIDPASIDLIVVPALAFSRDGSRLGYGGGYYDRYLARCPQATSIGLALPGQLVDNLPRDAWDIRLDHILTR